MGIKPRVLAIQEFLTHSQAAMSASIYCDGACSGNGTARAVGGWAWAYWPGAARGEPAAERAAPLVRPPHATNQRAELTALLEALRFAREGRTAVTVYSDSQYAINCASKWGPAWKRKGWKRDSGEPLQNLDLIQPLVELWTSERWPLVHVRGHQTGSGPHVWGAAPVIAAPDLIEFDISAAEHMIAVANEAPRSVAAMFEETDTISHVGPSARPAVPTRVGARQADIRSWFGGPSR
jgi:ribonuclease HI